MPALTSWPSLKSDGDDLPVDPALDRDHVRGLHRADRLEHDRHVGLDDGAGGDRHGLRLGARRLVWACAAAGGAVSNVRGSTTPAAIARTASAAIAAFLVTKPPGGGDCNRRHIIEDGPYLPSPRHPAGGFFDRRDRKNSGVSGISSAAVPRHDRRHQEPIGRSTAGKGRIMAAHDALRTILPVAGLSEDRARDGRVHRRRRPGLADPVPHRRDRRRRARRDRAGGLRSVGTAHRPQAAGRGRSAASRRIACAAATIS